MTHRKGMTAARLIEELKKLPADTLIFGFDVGFGERVKINLKYPIEFWDQENGHADINFDTTEPQYNPIADGKMQI